MYRQFWIDEKHQDYQRVLWQFKISYLILEYKIFSYRMSHHIANQEFALTKYPLAVRAYKEEFYVDDRLSGYCNGKLTLIYF